MSSGETHVTAIFAEQALMPEGWRRDVRLELADGRIAAVFPEATASPGDERHAIVLPAMPNLHSHAFQRGMAGLAETRGPGADSFWSWREVMYRFALTMTPDDVEAVAAQLYAEMLEAGFCRVGEFQYLHHAPDGRPYGDIAEMGKRIAAAASETGIGLTLLPVLYAHSGFGGLPPNPGQRRFINDISAFERLIESSRKALESIPEAIVGVAPHSLRAVTPEQLEHVTALLPGAPIHIHVAEQMREVDDCLGWSGQRPVEWLLENAHLDRRWCLIHATHMTGKETRALAATGATAGLCPITEANLGDGTFPGPAFTGHGGQVGIGSDSNVLIGVAEELRQLEYSQRLALRRRNVLAAPGQSNGRALFDAARAGGLVALGGTPGGLAPGSPADFLSLDASRPSLAGKSGDALLDSWIFTSGTSVDCMWVRGRKLVENGRHFRREAIARRFRSVMMKLASA